MNEHRAEMQRIIREIDGEAAIKLHKHIFPHLPPPANVTEAIKSLHIARTAMKTATNKERFYSHCWLRDYNLGFLSQLPDVLKPSAEKMYPIVARSVGIAVKSAQEGDPMGIAVRGVMEDAVRETYADGHGDDPKIVKGRMMEMRARFKRRA